MPVYNFQPQFAEAVQNGTKTQTIRPPRKRPTRPGDTLYLYTGLRTKAARKLGEGRCFSVRPLVIDQQHRVITLNGTRLADQDCVFLANLDGFVSIDAFFAWFQRYQPGTPLELIEWEVL